MKSIIFIIIIIIIIFIIPSSAYAATLSLSPATGTFNRGCDVAIKIELDTTATQTDGTDALLRYDTTRFTAKTITNGTIYPDYPGNNIDPSGGKITISGLASVAQPFTGKGILATINLTVLAEAPTTATAITFDFDSNDRGKTTDSNVVERGTVADVLSSVTNGNYTIGSGTSCAQGASGLPATGLGQGQISTPSAAPIAKKTVDQFVGGQPGSQQLTYTIAIVGSILVVLGILGLALL